MSTISMGEFALAVVLLTHARANGVYDSAWKELGAKHGDILKIDPDPTQLYQLVVPLEHLRSAGLNLRGNDTPLSVEEMQNTSWCRESLFAVCSNDLLTSISGTESKAIEILENTMRELLVRVSHQANGCVVGPVCLASSGEASYMMADGSLYSAFSNDETALRLSWYCGDGLDGIMIHETWDTLRISRSNYGPLSVAIV